METNSPRPLVIAIALIVIIGIVGGLIYYFNQPAKQITPEPETTDSFNQPGVQYQDSLELPPLPPENDVVNSYAGQITGINESGGTLTLETQRGVKTIEITNNTDIVQRSRPTREDRLAASQGGNAELGETAYQGTLQIGDIITVLSNVNIRGKDTFTADKIIITL